MSGFDFFLLVALAVPFVLGGRLAIGEFTLVVSAVGCSLCWGMHQLVDRQEAVCIWTKAELLLLLVIGIGLLQVVPLPPSVLETISPKIAEVLMLWDSSDSSVFGPWKFLSLTVGETRQALVLGVSYVLLFWLTAQRIRRIQDAHRLLRAICISAAVMATFAMLQFLTSNGKFYWFFEFPAGTTADRIKGAFPNKNHFAAYLSLAVGPYVWWLMDLVERTAQEEEEVVFGTGHAAPLPKSVRISLAAGGGAFIAVGLLSSMSRGAVVSAAAGLTVMVLVLTIKGMISKRLVAGLGALAIAAACLQLAVGYDKMMDRLNRWDDNGRLPIWKANIDIASDYPVLGAGIGSHRFVHLKYLDNPYDEHEATHAESNYLQVTSETGLVGLSVALLCLGVCLYWCWRAAKMGQERSYVVAQLGLLASLVSTMVGSIADFTWYIPGYTVILVLEMACACRIYQMTREEADPQTSPSMTVPRLSLASGFMLMLVAGAWMVQSQWPLVAAEPHWIDYRRLVFDAEEQQRLAAEEAEENSDERNARVLDLLSMKLQALRSASRANPEDSRFHLRLMRHYLLAFHELQRNSENSMPLSQLRDAVIANDFQSRDDMREWLNRAIGDSVKYADAAYRHGTRALKTNPLLFSAYLDLAELAFLGGANEDFHHRCVDQALILAPNEAQVLYVAGREALLKQDEGKAFEYWKRAFHRNRGVQFEIMRIMVGSGMELNGTSQVELMVKLFDPDIEALDQLAYIQKALDMDDECRRTVELLASKLEERATSEDTLTRAKDWVKAAGAFARIDQHEQVERCFKMALESSFTSYVAHFEYGVWLYGQRRGVDAREQLTWCSIANPRDLVAAKILERLSRGIFPDPIQEPTSSTLDSQQLSAAPSAPSTLPSGPPGLSTYRTRRSYLTGSQSADPQQPSAAVAPTNGGGIQTLGHESSANENLNEPSRPLFMPSGSTRRQ